MHIFKSKQALDQFLAEHREKGRSIGLVPTMGALHKGHLSLIEKALHENELVVISIFVNPTQFDKKDDLDQYPRNLEGDLHLLRELSQDLLIFTPTETEMYAGKIEAESFDFSGMDRVMEGAFRKGHFNGVGTVVSLLFEAVRPNKAYFGEKDYQQLQIIKKLVATKRYPLTVVACPILRETNGLAMSSRNERLSNTTRGRAGFIYETLKTAKKKFGTVSALKVNEWVKATFEANDLFELEYFQIANAQTLRPIERKNKDEKYRAFIAVFADGVRLIDNIALN